MVLKMRFGDDDDDDDDDNNNDDDLCDCSMKSGAATLILLTAMLVVSDSLFYPELGTETTKHLQKSIRQRHKATNQV